MNILVTGSSGWLGQNLVPRLKRAGHMVIGLDPVIGPTTDIVGTVADRDTVRKAIRDHRIQGIIHAGALHKPHVATHDATQFIATNVQGTLNLLQDCLLYTSDAADERSSVDLGGRRIIKKK